jgi:AcrR family transcriptional regulator
MASNNKVQFNTQKKLRLATKYNSVTKEIYFAAAKAINKNHASIPGMEQIAKELGGSRGILYYYFDSKGELLHKMQCYVHEQLDKALKPIGMDNSLTPRQKLERVIRTYTLVLLDNADLVRALWTDASLYEQPPKMRAVIVRRARGFYKQFEDLIAQTCGSEGLICSDKGAATRLIMSMADAICRWYRNDNGKLTAEQVADYLVSSVFAGFLVPDKTR